eukprot:6204115-Pleurochrysis_carterae.AAC.1
MHAWYGVRTGCAGICVCRSKLCNEHVVAQTPVAARVCAWSEAAARAQRQTRADEQSEATATAQMLQDVTFRDRASPHHSN